MKTIMARTPHESSFSSSKRYFHWKKKKEEDEEPLAIVPKSLSFDDLVPAADVDDMQETGAGKRAAKNNKKTAVGRLVRAALGGKHGGGTALGRKVVGTLFGHRRGHVFLAFQDDPKSAPAVVIELATPTSGLVREMASGLVRVALECDRRRNGPRLLEEPMWRTYCNGRKCGYAMRRECGAAEWKVLRAVEPISMGAGVLPETGGGGGGQGEMMYMRARFERVVGSKDSEAFYMMNPDGHGGPELSIYLLRV